MTEPAIELTVFQRKLAERKAAKEAASVKLAPVVAAEVDEDLIPEEQYTRSDADRAIDEAIGSIKILDAYARWCGKMTPKVLRGQTENIMVRCPIPGHEDKNPDAWVNTDKNTWYCGPCQLGGDSHDLAAYHYGFPVPGYKTGSTFHKLREKMAGDFGYTFTKLPGGAVMVNEPYKAEPETSEAAVETVQSSSPAESTPKETGSEPEAPLAPVIPILDDEDDMVFPALDWRAITPENTFMDAYMKATCVDDVAEEFHFFNGLIALGFALGRNVRLFDSLPVNSNLFVCTLGHSGSGKSKSAYHLNNLLAMALPYDHEDPNNRGVRKVSAPGSAEVLIYNFQKTIMLDPSNPKTSPTFLAPVSGLVEFSELSSLVSRTNRIGSALKPTLMQFYDMEKLIGTSSMGTGNKEAKDPFCSATTSTQPLALKSLLGTADDDSGFLNRWIFVAGPEKKHFSMGGVRVDMTPAVAPLQNILGWSAGFDSNDYMMMSPEALVVFDEFFHNTLEPARKRAQSALITRIDLLMKKMILLLSANKMEGLVSPETVREALVCYNYFLACYSIPEAQIGNSISNEIQEAIESTVMKQYKKDKKGLTLSQINRHLARRKYEGKKILEVCDSMVKLGILGMQTPDPAKTGPKTVRYCHVPVA